MPSPTEASRISTFPSEWAIMTADVMFRNMPHSTTPGMESIAACRKNALEIPSGNLQS